MKIVTAKWLFDGEEFFEDYGVAFEEEIVEVASAKELKERFKSAEVEELGKECVIIPGLINPHLHLEFGANRTTLSYGDFIEWLFSVIEHRDELVEECRAGCFKKQIDSLLEGGTTTFGAVSSYGRELKACVAAPQRVVFFNEAIGSQPAAVDALYADFMQRLEESEKAASKKFIPAVALHSPYSVHPVLIRKILQNLGERPLSAHFMESPAEREWLTKGEGPFKRFFEEFLKQSSPLCFPEEFLQLLQGKKALLTHAVQADESLLKMVADAGHYITHCPRSNRLLGCGRVELKRLEELGISWLLGTDGLSSNNSLNQWDEMRAALMMHFEADANLFALDLLKASTSRAADALGLETGHLKRGFHADIITVKLPAEVGKKQDLPLQLILHTTHAKTIYIGGERYI